MSVKVSDLIPEFREKLAQLIANCAAKNVRMVPTYTLRTPSQQAILWRQSRSITEIRAAIADLRAKGAPYLAAVLDGVGPQSGPEVTRVLPGNSWHQWGEAVDCTWEVDGKFEDSEQRKVNGVNGYAVYAAEAKALGLDAGFYWRSFKDSPHVQLRADANPIRSGMSWPEIDQAMRERFGDPTATLMTLAGVGRVGAPDAIRLSHDSPHGWRVYETTDQTAAVFRAKMAIDADGSPHAYHPQAGRGLDYLGNAGRPGNWWALVVGSDGEPIVQGAGDPAPGFYISATTLKNAGFTDKQAQRYIDSETVPYFVLPGGSFKTFTQAKPIRVGDLGAVYNVKTGALAFAIFADTGPNAKIGEGSIALAAAVGLSGNPKSGGTDLRDIVYVVFPGTGIGQGMPPADIVAKVTPVFQTWGGLGRIASYATL